MRNRDRPAPDRFWEKVEKTDTCWLWPGGTSPNGYGRFSVNGRMVNAHRWAYEECVEPIPVGLVIDHLCRNPPCVNPAHLEAVTQQENSARGQRAEGRDETCRNGHERTPENIYTRPDGQRDCRACKRASDLRRYYEKASA